MNSSQKCRHCRLHLEYSVSDYPRHITTGEDRNKDRFKNRYLCAFWKLPLSARCDKANAELGLLHPCINHLVPPSTTREYHPEALELLDSWVPPRGTWRHSICCRVLPLTCNVHCLFGLLERHNTSVFFVLIFIPTWTHAAENENRSSACWRPCWEDIPNCLWKANGWSCNSQQWHPRRFGCYYLSN